MNRSRGRSKSKAKPVVTQATRAVSRARKPLPRVLSWLLALGIGLTVLAASHEGRSSTDIIPECVDYMHTLRRCFGDSDVHTPTSWPTGADREQVRARCVDDRARLEQVCR